MIHIFIVASFGLGLTLGQTAKFSMAPHDYAPTYRLADHNEVFCTFPFSSFKKDTTHGAHKTVHYSKIAKLFSSKCFEILYKLRLGFKDFKTAKNCGAYMRLDTSYSDVKLIHRLRRDAHSTTGAWDLEEESIFTEDHEQLRSSLRKVCSR